MASLRVLLVEDHPLLQKALQALLSPHCTIVATLDRAENIADAVQRLQPDVLVLDVSLPGRSGMQVLPEIRNAFPTLGIVIATNHSEPIYRSEAFERGANAFVAKDRLQEELWKAVQEASSARRSEGHLRLSRHA
jgi:two-component system, NarL family, nitrate/nitrite response regulator NarL